MVDSSAENPSKCEDNKNPIINFCPSIGDDEIVYLFETFYISTKKNCTFQVKLTNSGICLRKDTGINKNPKEQKILLKDIIGCSLKSHASKKLTKRSSSGCVGSCSAVNSPTHHATESPNSDSSAYLHIYAYVLKKNKIGTNIKRERTTLTLRFRSFDKYHDNEAEAQKWKLTVHKLIRCSSENECIGGGGGGGGGSIGTSSGCPKKILIFINPKSGQGKGREMFQQKIVPLFMESETSYDLQLTKYRNFARDFVRQCPDIAAYKEIVVLGGDGMFFEVINGIMEREDWESILGCLSLGIIPSGSGNGLAKSIAHEFNEPYEPNPILSATLAVIKGKTTPIDFVRVETKSKIMFSVLCVGWGLISDIDIESERFRTIGSQRFTIWSIHRLINLRTYKGRVSYLKIDPIATKVDSNGLQKKSLLKHSTSCNTALDFNKIDQGDEETFNDTLDFDEDVISLETSHAHSSHRPRLDSWYSTVSKKSTYFSTTESFYQSIAEFPCCIQRQNSEDIQVFGPSSNIPALTTQELPAEWTVEEGDYIMVHAAYQTHLGSDCYFATSASLNDGIIWLLIIRGGVTRSQLLSFLLSLSSGLHLDETNPNIQMIPVKAFRIEPFNNEGNITVDGEVVEYGPIQGEIFAGLGNCIIPNSI